MSLNVSQVRARVAAEVGFSAVEQVSDSIICSTRRAGELPFAVYYFDIAQELPETQETLTKYQDRVIGSRYFEGSKSLQWSNYLYFITSGDRLASGELGRAKELIERDRSYARKFVISEEELDSVLKPLVIVPSNATPHASILSVWKDLLVKAGLDRAILSDGDLPARMKLIETSSTEPAIDSKVPIRSVDVKAASFIDSLQLKQFRSFPLRRSFEFGTVNLIFGANGSGKTSLLEAIELFYCGRNKRNPNESLPYELIAGLADDLTENATNGRKPKVFRDRNLAWYGQAEVKTNAVYLSFAQFNFLDTDAAVSLAESTSRVEEDLSKLLVGPDASKTWRDIERVDEAVTAKLRDLSPLESQIKEELAALDRRLKEAIGVKQESDSIRIRLEEMLHRVGWAVAQNDKDVFASSIVESLSELESLAQQAASLDWTEAPVSIDGLTKYCLEAKTTSEKADADIARLELLRKNEKRFADVCNRGQEALNLAEQVKRFIDAGLPNRTEELGKQQSAVATYSGWLAGCDDKEMGVLSTGEQDAVLAKYYDDAVLKRSAADALLVSLKGEHANFSKMRDQSLNLAQQLREIAYRILETSSKPDECPLCHTRFGTEELVNQINKGVDEHVEALGQTLLNQLRERERAVREATAAEAVYDWLRKFCKRASLAADISVRSAVVEVEKAKRALKDARVRLETLNRELLAIESQGLSMTKWEEVLGRLRELEFPLAEVSREAADRLLSVINQGLANSSQALKTERKRADELQQTVVGALGLVESGFQGLKRALSQLKERYATTEILRGKLLSFSSSLPWSGKVPLAELSVEAAAIRKVAAELQAALGREKQAKANYYESIQRKEQLGSRLSKVRQRIKRLTEVQTTFTTIRNKHSLSGAMKSALQQNHAGIEAIFSRIHSPADFRGLGSNLTTLVRKVDGKEARLSQISTGQRAAFALSIFLAQNAQLKAAPPVMLIDDPIAHVDDLNSLSFLDYLREVVLTGRRQIFFATANEKLATLFERKFDFLGKKGFRRFDLRREA
jgi:energy-coupling factor transporter ATP-binding protein EcfA2